MASSAASREEAVCHPRSDLTDRTHLGAWVRSAAADLLSAGRSLPLPDVDPSNVLPRPHNGLCKRTQCILILAV